MYRIVTLLILFGLTIYGQAQTLTIKDQENGQPLHLVSLSSESPKASATTNRQGQADISSFKGATVIEIRLLGYKTIMLSYDAIAQAGFIISLKPTLLSLDEIVISATRWEQNKRSIPNKITTIGIKEIQLQNPQTTADLLGTSGEVFIQKSQQGGGSPMIRGFSTNRLLYTIDGVRMNTAIFRSGNIQNVISIDPFTIEQTEVFFGPGSIIYGSDAIGGVMSFKTLTPKYAENDGVVIKGNATVRYSTANNEKTGHFHVSAGWKNWALTTSISHNNFGDLLMGTHGPDDYLKPFYVERIDSVDRVFSNKNPYLQTPCGYSQTNVMQKIFFKPAENLELHYGFHYSETSPYARYDRMTAVSSSGLPSYAIWNYGPQKWMMNHFEITHKNDFSLYDQVSFRVALQQFEESRIDRKFNASRLRTQLEEVLAFSVNADFIKKTGKHQFIYGLEAVHNKVDSKADAINIITSESISVPDRYPQSTWGSQAAYLNYQLRFSERILGQAGLRYAHYGLNADFKELLNFYPTGYESARVNNEAVTGSLGIIFTPTDDWTLSVDAATGFRAPNVDDIGKMFDFAEGNVIVPNPDLKAEYAYNAEFSIARIVDDRMKIDLTLFYTLLDNAMVRRPYEVSGQDSIMYNGAMSKVFAIQNAAEANIFGLNAGLEVNLNGGFGFSGKINYQTGEEEMEDGSTSPSRHVAPLFGLAKLTFKKEKLNMQVYTIFNGEINYDNLNAEEKQKPDLYAKDADGNPYAPGWITLNFKALYQLSDILTISAGIENLTDRLYRPYSSGLAAPGRNFLLSLMMNF
ncbi:MAG TPA: TonB-dependent receptor [Bacteroidales bacterium]|nr:TonB-dependent receptor [Bacteroidales bacterium]HRW95919.1 TonB-dependent receptor [Bacteroidales bacterium]